MISLASYVRQGRHTLRRWVLDPRIHRLARGGAYLLAGFCLSAASLASSAMPLAMGLVCACSGWTCLLTALGAAAGYWLFWPAMAQQALVWTILSLVAGVALSERKILRNAPLLLPATAALIVSGCGLLFQSLGRDGAQVSVYLLRVVLAFSSAWLFYMVLQGRNPILDWMACGLAVLALAQIVPLPYLGLGYLAAGALVTGASFPAAALAGLALDLAQITAVPMTAVMALSYLVRFLPRYPVWLGRLAPGAVYILVMELCGQMDLHPLPGLVLGGILGTFLPAPARANHRRGETGAAQVRLELAAGVLAHTEQVLLEAAPVPVDEGALVAKAAERACGSCPYRKSCKDTRRIGQLPGLLLHKPLLHSEELPIICRKSGRFLAELHRSQEQLRSIQADRERQREYRAAVVQQYRFLAEFLQDLSDQLVHRVNGTRVQYAPVVSVYSNRPQFDNGDRYDRFSGTGSLYYVLLCDGMGTGLGAVQEGQTAGMLLRRLLSAGYPAEHALRSLNSLCALRDRAGAVTLDLAQIQLDTGKVTLYKWGAAPSYLIRDVGAEKLGSVGPPPGLSVTDCTEQTYRCALHRGQTLIMASDGIDPEAALRCCLENAAESPGELAARLLTCCDGPAGDDATVIMITLSRDLEKSES